MIVESLGSIEVGRVHGIDVVSIVHIITIARITHNNIVLMINRLYNVTNVTVHVLPTVV